MKPRTLTDFMFAGVAVIPAVCVWRDGIGCALSAFVALLIAACLCGWREQADAAGESKPEDAREHAGRDPPEQGGRGPQ